MGIKWLLVCETLKSRGACLDWGSLGCQLEGRWETERGGRQRTARLPTQAPLEVKLLLLACLMINALKLLTSY